MTGHTRVPGVTPRVPTHPTQAGGHPVPSLNPGDISMVTALSLGGTFSVATSIAWTSTQHQPLAQGPATALDPRGTPVRPPTPPYQHAGAEEEAVDGLGDVGSVDLVVVRVPVLPVAGLQRIQQRRQEDGGDLR